MKARTAKIIENTMLGIMLFSATLAMLAQFFFREHNLTGLIMLIGFWPEFLIWKLVEQRRIYGGCNSD